MSARSGTKKPRVTVDKLKPQLRVSAKPESAKALAERARQVCEGLARAYPDAHCELDFTNPLELLIATILSAQCTDKRVNIVTKELFRRCRTAAEYASISSEELEGLIQSTGFFRNKAKSIRACSADLVAKHGGKVPRTMEELHALAGVGRKTANVVLGNAYGINEGVVVDTHVQRLSLRLGFTAEATPEKIEQDLMALIPQEKWAIFSHWLIWHGRRRCTARKPDCPNCEVAALCPSAFKVGEPGSPTSDDPANPRPSSPRPRSTARSGA